MSEVVPAPAGEKLEDRPQYYAAHLSEVNKTCEVFSTEDIYNDRGILIAKSGSRIDASMSEKILMHKLAKPLFAQVDIPGGMSNANTGKHFAELFERYPDLRAVVDSNGGRGEFELLVNSSPLPTMLLQHLTVLQLRKPDIFEKALFCSVLSMLAARRMGLHESKVRAAYFAGLFHDVGLLHIPADVLDKRGELSPQEWRAVQSHVVIGQLLAQQAGHRLPPLTARAVLEHHERCDGSGYPTGRGGADLHVMGQILALADSLQAIRVNQFSPRGLNLANASPYLQMNETTHTYEVYAAFHGLLKRSGLQPVQFNPQETLDRFVRRLSGRCRALEKVLTPLARVVELAAEMPSSPKQESVRRVSERVMRMINTSGLLSGELAGWLARAAEQPPEGLLGELDEIELMQNELRWQLGSVRRTLGDYLEQKHRETPALTALRQAHAAFGAAVEEIAAAGEW